MSEWFDNEDFWRIFGKCMFRSDRFDDARTEIDQLIALAGIPVSRVLDLGCGPGRHAVPMAELGVEVTALDLSSTLLDQARSYADQRAVEIHWVEADMRSYANPGHFDLIISMWTSFGYFENPADDRRVLARCLENLAPGGATIIDVVGKEYVARHLEPVHLTEYEDGSLLIERPVLEDDMSRYANEWILVDGDRAHRAEWHHNLYSGRELSWLLDDAGFEDVRIFGSLDGDAYDLDAERLVAVGRKPR